MALGYTGRWVADAIGMTTRHHSKLLRGELPDCRAVTARTVATLLQRVHLNDGPSERTRIMARNRGYLRIEEWLPDELGDPDADPRPRREANTGWFDQGLVDAAAAGLACPEQLARMNPRERDAAIDALRLYAPGFVAARLGINERTVHRARARSRGEQQPGTTGDDVA